ncbi:MAG: hypothetical protein ACRDSR_03800 [Pseudonocardiaceae bacterium]
MTAKEFLPILLAAVAALTVEELASWCPRLAEQLACWSARRLGDDQTCERYEEEYLANLGEVPGKVSKLLVAFGFAVNVPRMRWALRAERLDRAEPAEIPARDVSAEFRAIL